jgi:hypothetical protein
MLSQAELKEYLDEIREQVCSRCVEHPEGGPPCFPLGKPCGIEMHLPELIDTIHNVHSEWLGPYVAGNRDRVCPCCPIRGDSHHCPCPMETLIGLIVPAVEAVDRRREQRKRLVELWSD